MSTSFQTSRCYDFRLDLGTDIAIVHRHSAPVEAVVEAIRSWQEKDYEVHRMFFIGSDAGRIYVEGKFDGQTHWDEAETGSNGNIVFCTDRPYMVPTENWNQYLKERLIRPSIEAGVQAICPEEPLAHTYSGYSEAFKKEWAKFYGEPWQDPSSSPEAFFKASKLKSHLYLRCVKEMLEFTKSYSKSLGAHVKFILPTHCLISHAAGRMIYPCGETTTLSELDGFIGQVWTGPIGWSLATYAGRKETRDTGFFESAFVLYSYFANLVRKSDKKMYFLADPVEDNPRYSWPEYEVWYKKSLVAKLFFPNVGYYEVMPWPERIFMPGYKTAGGTPGPEHYLTQLLIILAALGDMHRQEDTKWDTGTQGIGVLVSDTLGWQSGGPSGSSMDSLYGLVLPLLKKGVPTQVLPMERISGKGYLDEYNVILLTYDASKPLRPEYHRYLGEWIRNGGVLIFTGGSDEYNKVSEWWRNSGYQAPQDHLFHLLGILRVGAGLKTVNISEENSRVLHPSVKALPEILVKGCTLAAYARKDLESCVGPIHTLDESDLVVSFEACFGKGHVVHVGVPTAFFAKSSLGAELIRSIVKYALEGKLGTSYKEQGHLKLQRGNYIVAQSLEENVVLRGNFLNLFDVKIPLLREFKIQQGENALLYDARKMHESDHPCLLFSSHKLLSKREDSGEIVFSVKGPSGTKGVARIALNGKENVSVGACGPEGMSPLVQYAEDDDTLYVSFQNSPEGITVKARFSR